MLRRRQPTSRPTEETFQRLVETHAAGLYRVAFAVVRDPHIAEDVVQDAIVKAWQNIDSFRGDGSLDGWLSSIAHRTALSYVRSRRDTATDPVELLDTPAPSDVERVSALQHDVAAVFAAIDQIDEPGRSIILLRDVDGRSYNEIAEILGLPIPTVKTRLLRARRYVQNYIDQGVIS